LQTSVYQQLERMFNALYKRSPGSLSQGLPRATMNREMSYEIETKRDERSKNK